jgi:glucosamine 6-phosphate synthetase-like amidotransferase/phosphosugar isomerase protein
MCGICGIVAPAAPNAWKFRTIERLLRESQFRGSDATGVAFTHPERGLFVLKDGVKAEEFVGTKQFKALHDTLPSIVIGHTRGATRRYQAGQPKADPDDNKNNHPFFSPESGIALVHNGSVDDEFWRNTAGEPNGLIRPCAGGTDSEVLLRVLETFAERYQNESFLQNIEDMCFNIAGKYTLAIINENIPDKLWLVKHRNPLVIAYIKSLNIIVFASTEDILKKAVKSYKSHLEFFIESVMPDDMIINEMREDQVVEITLPRTPKGKFKLRALGLSCATDDYTFHKKQAEEEAKAAKEAEEETTGAEEETSLIEA